MLDAKGATAGIVSSQASRREVIRAPPNTPASTLTSVMPTCTVGRNRCGSSESSRAVVAPLTPAFSITVRRARRTETSASSLMANRPFSRTSRKTTISSRLILMRATYKPRRLRETGASVTHVVMNRPLPPIAMLLGIAGLIPFVVCGLGALAAPRPDAERSLWALIAYGAVILAFLGGVHWGFGLDEAASPPANIQRARFGLGVLP